MKQQVKRGTTSGIFHVRILDASVTTGAGLTGLAFNTAGLLCRRLHSRSTLSDAVTLEDISTLGTYAAPTSNAHMRFKEISGADPTKGLYEIHVHNDWLNPASPIPNLMIFMAGATNMSDMALEVEFVDNVAKDNYDRLGALRETIDAIDTSAEMAARFDAIKGVGWTTETLKAIKDAVDVIPAMQGSESCTITVYQTGTTTPIPDVTITVKDSTEASTLGVVTTNASGQTKDAAGADQVLLDPNVAGYKLVLRKAGYTFSVTTLTNAELLAGAKTVYGTPVAAAGGAFITPRA